MRFKHSPGQSPHFVLESGEGFSTYADKVDQARTVDLAESTARAASSWQTVRVGGACLVSRVVEHGLHELEDFLQGLSLSGDVRYERTHARDPRWKTRRVSAITPRSPDRLRGHDREDRVEHYLWSWLACLA